MELSRSYIFIIAFCFSIPSLADSQQSGIDIVKNEVDSIYYRWDEHRHLKLIGKIDSMKIHEEGSTILNYYSGILSYSLAKIIYNSKPDSSLILFKKAAHDLEICDELYNDAEIKSLLAAVYGKITSLSTFSIIYWGLKAKRRIEEAHELDSNSAKVNLIAAELLMQTPERFGGSKKKSKRLLLKAYKFANPSNDKQVSWALKKEIIAYLAQLSILENDIHSSKRYIDSALNVDPSYGFVKNDLRKQYIKLLESNGIIFDNNQ